MSGPRKAPSQVQLPGGIVLKGVPFEIVDFHDDGSPKTFQILPPDREEDADCRLYADETWIRGKMR